MTIVAKPVIYYEWGIYREVFTTLGTLPLSFVTQLFWKTIEMMTSTYLISTLGWVASLLQYTIQKPWKHWANKTQDEDRQKAKQMNNTDPTKNHRWTWVHTKGKHFLSLIVGVGVVDWVLWQEFSTEIQGFSRDETQDSVLQNVICSDDQMDYIRPISRPLLRKCVFPIKL